MSKPYKESDFSDLVDNNLTVRIKELSDLKKAIKNSDEINRLVLLKALVALAYANWEGFVKFSAQTYFEFITIRKLAFATLAPQYYYNSFVTRLGGLSKSNQSLSEKIKLIEDILNSHNNRFSSFNASLIDTGSNLKSSILRDISTVCDIDYEKFVDQENFIDVILLKRRNSIAHGDESIVGLGEVDEIINRTIALMRLFKNELENNIYTKKYIKG